MQPHDTSETAKALAHLRAQHRDLDAAIEALARDVTVDQLEVRRLKKRKLQLKDQILRLESWLIPDLDA